MWGGTRQRGVSEVLGAILVFAILVSGVAVYQVTVVPQTNEEREFEHSQQVRSGMQDLRSAIVTTGAGGGPRSVSVRTSVDYPTRLLTLNPPEPGGSLSATAPISDAIVLSGLEAVDPEAADHWSTGASAFTFESRHLRYRPSYNYYRDAPTTRYEPTVVYSSFDDAQVVESQQSLVSGRTLNLMLLEGDVGGQGPVESLDVNPSSTATRTITLEPDGNATLQVRTGLSKATWEDLLASNIEADVASYDASTDPNTVTIDLADGVTWRLRVSRVSLNRPGPTMGPEYITVDGSAERTLNPGSTTDVTVRVLDQHGSPVEGVEVYRNWGPSRTTGGDGRVTFEYSIPGNVTLDTWFGDPDVGAVGVEQKISYDFDVSSPSTGEPDANIINPGSGLVLQDSNIDGSDDNIVRLEFLNRNSAPGAFENVSEVRVNFYKLGPPGGGSSISSRTEPQNWRSNVTNSGSAEIGGRFLQSGGTPAVGPGNSTAIEVEFTPSGFGIEATDYFVLSLVFEDGSSRIYFVNPE